MKTKRHLLVRLCFAVMVAMFVFGAISCNNDEPVDYGEAGIYYCDVTSTNEYLLELDNQAFTLTTDNDVKKGTYSYNDKKKAFDLSFTEGMVGEGRLSDSKEEFVLSYGGSTYTFVRRVEYTVSFEVDGGAAIDNQTVRNGRTAIKPADPVKQGYKFIGWYKDAAFTAPFAFETTVITGNITVYARFVAVGDEQTEFKVTFIDGGEVVETRETIGGAVYDLPEGKGENFLGWWVSAYNKADKLTAQYAEGGVFNSNTNLYAVYKSDKLAISVTEKNITWESAGTGKTYSVNVKKNGATVKGENVQVPGYSFDFSGESGEYVVEVTVDGVTSVAYYIAKGLARVSNYIVTEDNVIVFDGVENADSYVIDFICGSKNHNHLKYKNGNSTVYSFENCDIPKDGFKFTITASGKGYVSSVSEEFVYNRLLDAVTNVNLNEEKAEATWDKVEGAEAYDVYVSYGSVEEVVRVTDNKFSFKYYTGSLRYNVTPVAKGYNATATNDYFYTKNSLVTPADIHVETVTEGGATVSKLLWSEVAGATSYKVVVDGTEYTANGNSFVLKNEYFNADITSHVITVQALGEHNSLVSDDFVLETSGIAEAYYNNHRVYWTQVFGVNNYVVSVNGVETTVSANESSAEIKLTANENNVQVWAVKANGEATEKKLIVVQAYKVTLVSATAIESEVIYVAMNDTLNIPAPGKQYGQEFGGWYNIPNGAENNGRLYADETVFTDGKDITLYAYWGGVSVSVKLNLNGHGSLKNDTTLLVYEKHFSLEVPENDDTSVVFAGWFSGLTENDIQYTDRFGDSLVKWNLLNDKTLYAVWYDVINFKLINNGKSYAVEKGVGIDFVDTVIIPATHEGKPVVEIGEEAFANCTNLVYVQIPDSVTLIAEGVYDTKTETVIGAAFNGCSKLREITVVGNKGESSAYLSEGGVLFRRNFQESKVELALFPYAKDGSYVMPDGVSAIPAGAFRGSKISEISLPYTINTVGRNAFASCSNLKSITFRDVTEGVDVDRSTLSLTVEFGAFYTGSSSNLKKLYLPAWISDFDYLSDDDLKDSKVTGGVVMKNIDKYTSPEGNLKMLSSKGSYNNTIYSATGIEDMRIIGEGGKYTSSYVDWQGNRQEYGYILNSERTKIVYVPRGFTPVYADGTGHVYEGVFRAPSGVTEIGEKAFEYNSHINELIVPAWVTEIGVNAFKYCRNLNKVTFEGKSTSESLAVREGAFYGCTQIKEITLPENLFTLEKNAFGGTNNLKEVTVESFSTDPNKPLAFENDVFATVNSRTSAENPTSSGDFRPVYYVTTIKIGLKVTMMDIGGIFGKSVEQLEVDDNHPVFAVRDGVLFDRDITVLVYYPSAKKGDYEIPETVKVINSGVFYGNTNIETLTIGKNVAKIGDKAFMESGISKFVFVAPDAGNVVGLEIGDEAFRSARSISGKFELPGRTRKLGNRAFYQCYYVNEIVIPEGVEEIGDEAFAYCYSTGGLEKVTLPSTLKKFGKYETDKDTGAEKLASFNPFEGSKLLKYVTITDGEHFASRDGAIYMKTEGVVTDLLFSAKLNTGNNGVVTIPNTVIKLWDGVFKDNAGITEIVFEKSDTARKIEVGKEVFINCTSLKKIELPDGLDTIGAGMFSGCSALTYIYVPNTVTTVGSNAFGGCSSLTEIKFQDAGNTPETKKPLVFEDGKSEKVTDPSGHGYSTVYYGAVSGCDSLKELKFPNRDVVIGKQSFFRSTIEKITFGKGNLTLNEQSFAESNTLKKVIFDGETNIGVIPTKAFYNSAIEEIVLPETLTEIKVSAFSYTKIKEIVIPKSVKTIGEMKGNNGAFEYSDTETVTFKEGSAVENLGWYSFNQNKKLTTVRTLMNDGTYRNALPEGIEVIGKNVFAYSGLVTLEIPSTVTEISQMAFYSCKQLDTVTFAENSNLAKFGIAVFASSGIRSISFPKVVNEKGETQRITFSTTGSSLFDSCLRLEEAYLSSSVQSIANVFPGSTVKKVTVEKDHPAFKTDEKGQLLTSVDGTNIILVLGEITGKYIIPDKVVQISDNAFQNQASMTGVYIPDTVKYIGDYAFDSCYSLTDVEFAENVSLTSLGAGAFAKCLALKEITLPKVTTLGKGAEAKIGSATGVFSYCINLEKVTLSDDITTICNNMFCYTLSLKSINIPKKIKTIGANAFNYSGITSVSIPNSEKLSIEVNTFTRSKLSSITFETDEKTGKRFDVSFGSTPFAYTLLTEVVFPEGMKTLPSLSKVSTLTKVTIPSTVTAIPANAFEYTGLTSVTLPENLTTIGNYAFQFSALKEITVPDKVTTIGNYAFKGCADLVTVKGMKGVTSLGDYAFMADGTEKDGFKTSLTTVEGLTNLAKLGKQAFYGCEKLENLGSYETTVENGVTIKTLKLSKLSQFYISSSSTKGQAFECAGLTDYVFEMPLVTEIPTKTFRKSGVRSVKFDKAKLKTIDTYAFELCEKLETLTGIEGVTKLGGSAFKNSTLKGEYNFSKVTTVGDNVFVNSKVTKVDLSGATNLKSCYNLFLDCAELTEVVLSNNATTISHSMFENCVKLNKVNIPTKLTYLNTDLFMNSGITSIEIPANIKKIGATSATGKIWATTKGNVFSGCKNLTTVTVKGTDVELAGYSFVDCEKLTTVGETAGKLDTSVFSVIGTLAFEGAGLTSVNIGKDTEFLTGTSGVFAGNTKLTTVTFEEGVTTIPSNMFGSMTGYDGCTALTNVTLPKSLVTIKNDAFEGCTALTKITLPEGLKTIEDSAFSGCKLTEVTLPSTLETVGGYAFVNNKLATLNIPASVTSIGQSAFAGCPITEMKVAAGNTVYEVRNDLLYTKDKVLVFVPNTYVGELRISAGYTVAPGAFNGCYQITKIVLPSDMTEISENMFYGYNGTMDIAFPSTLVKIGDYAFNGVKGLKGNVVIPEGVEEIGEGAFRNCVNVENVTLPSTLKKIGKQAFSGCTNLKSINLVEGLTELGNRAFEQSGLTSITIPSTLKLLDYWMFDKCASLETVEFAKNSQLESVSYYVFRDCPSLKEVVFPEGVKCLDSVFGGDNSSLKYVHIPGTVIMDKDNFDEAFLKNNKYVEKVTVGEGLTEIAGYNYKNVKSYGFVEGCTNLKEVVLPSTLTCLSLNSFKGCTNLTTVYYNGTEKEEGVVKLPAGLTTIESSAFKGCEGIKKIVLPAGVTEVGDSAFANCINLESVYTVGEQAKVGTVRWPNGAKVVPATVVEGCAKITEFVLPENVENLGKHFLNGTNVTEFTVPGTIKVLNGYVFEDNDTIVKVTLEEGIEETGTSVFDTCASLETVVINAKLLKLQNYTFMDCPNLKTVNIPDTVTEIGLRVFDKCTSITELFIPKSVVKIGSGQFDSWTASQTIKFEASPRTVAQTCNNFNASWLSVKVNVLFNQTATSANA